MESPDPLSTVKALVGRLRRSTLRTRIGVWFMPLNYVGSERDIAARLGVEAVDARQPILQRLPKDTRYVRLTAGKVLEALDSIASHKGNTDCALVYNVDLLLAGLKREERQSVWQGVFDGLPYRVRALVIAIPVKASALLPTDRLCEALRDDGRLE